MTRAEQHIKDMRERRMKWDEEVFDSLSGAIDRLEKAFPRYGSFLMEFVQNADDAKSRSLRIEFCGDKCTMRISNDGEPFGEKNVKSICNVGRSSKTAKDYIGYLGVGFKAVFLVSDCVQILSGEYKFKFEKEACPKPEHTPWQIIPVWLDNATDVLPGQGAIFGVTVKTPELLRKLRGEVSEENLNRRLLLFLRHIRRISVVDPEKSLERKMVKSEDVKTEAYSKCVVEEYDGESLKTRDRWVVFKSVCEVPEQVKKDDVTVKWERDEVEKREIAAAFRITDEGLLRSEDKGTAHIGAFSFLPLKEVPTGLNFLLQGDFLTTPGRGELARECLWNRWLAQQIYELLTKKCVAAFLDNERWKLNFTEVLYSSPGGHELFEVQIRKPLNEFLRGQSVLVAKDGSRRSSKELVSINKEMQALLSDEDVETLYPGKRVLHPNCRPFRASNMKEGPKDVHEFLSMPNYDTVAKNKAEDRDIDWFRQFYSMLAAHRSLEYFLQRYSTKSYSKKKFWEFWAEMRGSEKPIILTEDYEVAKIGNSYVNPKGLDVPEALRNAIKIVHGELAEAREFGELCSALDADRDPGMTIRELTKDVIKDTLKTEKVLMMTEAEWRALPEEERFERIREIKRLSDGSQISLEEYDFITVKDKSGEWLAPDELILPEEFSPGHKVEKLVKKGLLDWPVRFVSSEFVGERRDGTVLRQWQRFFKGLGVDSILKKKSEGGKGQEIVERVAILTSLQYERLNEREARELGQSENPGYDIESRSGADARCIEVKGTRSQSDDVFLTANELAALKHKNSYYLYRVVEALANPVLQITGGRKLKDIVEGEGIKVAIPYRI